MMLDKFVDDIVRLTTGDAIIIGPGNKNGQTVFFLNEHGDVEMAEIEFNFAPDVSRGHRNARRLEKPSRLSLPNAIFALR